MTRQELLDYLTKNGGATNNEVAAHFSVTPALAATRTKQLFDGGYVTREETGRTVSGVQILKHFAKASVTPAMPKKERIKAEQPVREREENGGISGMIQSLADALAKQIASSVVASLQQSLTRELANVVPPALPAPKPVTLNLANLPAPKDNKPRVGIVGLLPAQVDAINKEFADVFDIYYWKDDGVSSLKSIARNCEVVLVTRWCNHKATEIIKSVGGKWRFVGGGLTELKTMLTALYVES